MSTIWIRHNAQAELRENIRNLAKKSGLTQRALADRAGVKLSRLSNCLHNYNWISQDEVSAFAEALDVSAGKLLGASIYRDDPRAGEFNYKPAFWGGSVPDQEKQRSAVKPVESRKRALCCMCGSMREWSQHGRNFLGDLEPNGRFLRALKCVTCGENTKHALLRAPDDQCRDVAEHEDRAPLRSEQTRADLMALVERMRGFNTWVTFRQISHSLKKDHPVVAYEWDGAKSQWRFEIDPSAPALVQLRLLQKSWKEVAAGEWTHVDWDPKDGVWMTGGDTTWTQATDDLIADMHRMANVEKRRLADHVAHQAINGGQASL